jgi:hypothetical protein
MTPFGKFVNEIARFESLIKRHADLSWKGIHLSNNEPAIVKEYLLSKGVGVDYMNWHISNEIHLNTQYTVKFASVFVHGKPRITRTATSQTHCKGSTPQCELGDLMYALVFVDNNKNIIHTAAHISQAKKGFDMSSRSQQCLYDKDLEFEMPKNVVAQSSNSNSLRYLPDYTEHRNQALSYLYIGKRVQVGMVPYTCNTKHYYGNFIYRMMTGSMGKPFIPPPSGDNGWNCIIDDLINVGTGKNPSSQVRGFGLDFVLDSFNYFLNFEEYQLELPHEGMPSMFIIVQDRELNIQH